MASKRGCGCGGVSKPVGAQAAPNRVVIPQDAWSDLPFPSGHPPVPGTLNRRVSFAPPTNAGVRPKPAFAIGPAIFLYGRGLPVPGGRFAGRGV